MFLFNRKAVRFFRKDGHEWRKKADGKTVRETHEKLKVQLGSWNRFLFLRPQCCPQQEHLSVKGLTCPTM